MFDLTSSSLLGLCVAAAALSVIAVAILALRERPYGLQKRVLHAIPLVVTVLLAQLFAILSMGLIVNNQYGFYTSWADFLGEVGPAVSIVTAGLVPPSQGTAVVYRVPRSGGIRDNQVLVWFPPEYRETAYEDYRFPVVMFMPGSPGQPGDTFAQYQFSTYATNEIARHHVPPFIGVFPTMTTNPPRDTECTNVANGPQVLTWLARTVPHFLLTHLRVASPGANWTAMGWSTGGFCATKLMLTHPNLFGSAVNFGGYYTPLQDNTTGSLFGRSRQAYNENSPLWLYQQYGLGNNRLLMIAGHQDGWSWYSTRTMIHATYGDPGSSHLVFPVGGHNYHTYRMYLPAALDWSAQGWAPWGDTGTRSPIRPSTEPTGTHVDLRHREMPHR